MSSEAVAPVIISTSSPVITACRVRLKRIWYLLIISPAFLEAFCRDSVSTFTSHKAEKSSREDLCFTYVHGISAGRDFASVALSQTPVDGVGERVFSQVGQELLVDLESREVF